MMIKELLEEIESSKEIINVLPENNITNRKKKIAFVEDKLSSAREFKEGLEEVMAVRYQGIESHTSNPKILEISDNIEKCKIANEWNKYNTCYEKMHLDYYLYQLKRYYKEDLESVNACIVNVIKSFSKQGIELTADDFNFSPFVNTYMKSILSKDDNIKEVFEGIYYKCPNLITLIELNLESLYNKYEKKIESNYADRKKKFLEHHSEDELSDMLLDLTENKTDLINIDDRVILDNFKNKVWTIHDFDLPVIDKKKKIFFSTIDFNYDVLIKLKRALEETSIYLKNKHILDDMRNKVVEKDSYKDKKKNCLKEISDLEKNLFKLNDKKYTEKKGLFGKIGKSKSDDKLIFSINDTVKQIGDKRSEMELIEFEDIIYNTLNNDCTVFEALKSISSNYLYYVSKCKELDDGKTIKNITDDFEDLKNIMNTFRFSILNYQMLNSDFDIKTIVYDKFKLANVSITIEQLELDTIENLLKDINTIIYYEGILKSNLTIDDLLFYGEYLKFIEIDKKG